MTAHDQMRAMLDQLMGTSRNGEYCVDCEVFFWKISKFWDSLVGLPDLRVFEGTWTIWVNLEMGDFERI